MIADKSDAGIFSNVVIKVFSCLKPNALNARFTAAKIFFNRANYIFRCRFLKSKTVLQHIFQFSYHTLKL